MFLFNGIQLVLENEKYSCLERKIDLVIFTTKLWGAKTISFGCVALIPALQDLRWFILHKILIIELVTSFGFYAVMFLK